MIVKRVLYLDTKKQMVSLIQFLYQLLILKN